MSRWTKLNRPADKRGGDEQELDHDGHKALPTNIAEHTSLYWQELPNYYRGLDAEVCQIIILPTIEILLQLVSELDYLACFPSEPSGA